MADRAGPPVEPLSCPSCARTYTLEQRFCPVCEMPLVYSGRSEAPVTASHERARKVRPEYVGGELVKVAFARNQAEAELIQGMLLEEGIPSMERRMRGFEIPDFMAGGPRDVLVPEAGAELARELLGGFGDETQEPRGLPRSEPMPYGVRLALGLILAVLLAAAIVLGLYLLTT